MKFKCGDRVRFIGKYNVDPGETGTVYGYSNNHTAVGVRWDKYDIHRHSLHDCWTECPACKRGHGWFVSPRELELITDVAIGLEELI